MYVSCHIDLSGPPIAHSFWFVGGSTLIANLYFAHVFNNEELFTSDLVAVVIITLSATILSLTAPAEEDYNIAALKTLFTAPVFIIYLAVQIMFMLALQTWLGILDWNKVKDQSQGELSQE